MEKQELNTENKFKGLFIIGYGLSGGFGGAITFEVIQVDTQEEADKWAWESACNDYERYAGSNGLRDLGEIMEEDGIDDEDVAWEVFCEEREGWLDYSAQPYSKEYEEEVRNHHYQNNYKEITD